VRRIDSPPDSDYVTRACGRRGFDKGRVTARAFEMKKVERPLRRISADWVECQRVPRAQRTVEASITRLRNRGIRPGQAVALLSIAGVRTIRVSRHSLNVIEDGSLPCHCPIVGFTNSHVDSLLMTALAQLANANTVQFIAGEE